MKNYVLAVCIFSLFSAATVLAQLDPVAIYIREANRLEGGSLNNYLPVYCAGSNNGLFSLHPSSGSIDAPVFMINGEASVATESLAWDGVKSLYR